MTRKNVFQKNNLDSRKVGLLCMLLIAGFFLLLTLSVKTIFASATVADEMSMSVYLPLITKAVPEPRLAEPQVFYEEECGGGTEFVLASPATLDFNPDLLGFRATIYNADGKTIYTEYLWNGEIRSSGPRGVLSGNPATVDTAAWAPQPTWGPSCDWTVPSGQYEARFYLDGVLLGTASATVDGPHSKVHP